MILLCEIVPVPITCSLENGGGRREITLSYGARIKDDMRTMVKRFVEKGALIWMISASPQMICEIAAEQLGIARERVLAFGDSQGDLTMLKMAKYPVVVNGSTKLLQQAEGNGWWVYSESTNPS